MENIEIVEHISIITADEGKIFRRISDGTLYGKEISLGYSYYINGVKLDEPHLDIPEDFEQIDDPNIEENEVGGDK
jgi:hypothetical protein